MSEQLVVDVLATWRLVRLVQRDTITRAPRQAVLLWATNPTPDGTRAQAGWVADLLDCPWCLAVWAALVVRLLPRWVRRLLAVAAVAGALGQWDAQQ